MIIIVKYRAVHFDNRQGGSGITFVDMLVYNETAELTLREMESNAVDNIKGIGHQFVGEIQLISIEVRRDFHE